MARLPYIVPYDPDFLGDGFRVPLPSPVCKGKLIQSGHIFDYIHYSLTMHQDRRMAVYAAHNIDLELRQSVPRTDWDLDPRIDRSLQTGAAAYFNNPWDRGHLVRRAAVAWGARQEARDASDATFYYTNASPQHEKFNQDEWVALEDWVLDTAGDISTRLCVFTGPIYTKMDQFHHETRIPSAFWKVIVLRDPTAEGEDLAALGFVMKQNEMWEDWNGADTMDLHLYQVGIADIGVYTGLEFGALAVLDEFEWRQPRFRDRSRLRPVLIEGPQDIQFFGDRRRARGIRALRVGQAPSPPTGGGRSALAPRPCGCTEDVGPTDERIDELAAQVATLRETVEELLETSKERGGETRSMREVRTLFARIVGGEKTQLGEFPDCACIGNNGRWFCSGVLVHERVVLTAAHCAPAIDRVYLGGISINLAGAIGEVVPVERVIVHPDYDPDRVPSHDIAVLILSEPAETAPVGIAATTEVNAEGNVRLVGFGYEHPSLPLGFGTKRKVEVPLTTFPGFGEEQIREVERLHGFDDEFEMHAGRKHLGKDSCNGDSGGPAYIEENEVIKVAAVTSRAAFSSTLPCGDGGIYTRIAPYLPWLSQVTEGMIQAPEGEPKVKAGAQVYISAAMPNPAGRDRGREWIEVTNAGDQDAALEGYTLQDKQGGEVALSGALSAGAALRTVLAGGSPIRLSNRGDEIALFYEDQEIHRVSYESAGSGEIIRFQRPVPIPEKTETPPFKGADPC